MNSFTRWDETIQILLLSKANYIDDSNCALSSDYVVFDPAMVADVVNRHNMYRLIEKIHAVIIWTVLWDEMEQFEYCGCGKLIILMILIVLYLVTM